MRYILAAVLLAAITGTAHADPFRAVSHDCKNMDAKRDGLKCSVVEQEDGMNLLMYIHTSDSANESDKERTAVNVRRTIQNFLAAGGQSIQQRRKTSSGAEMTRHCSRVRGRSTEHCGDWQTVSSNPTTIK